MKKKKQIFVIGSYGAGNIGDEAILKVIKKNLGKDFKIKVAVTHLPYSLLKIPFRLKTLWSLWKSDFILLGGGGLFTDSDTIKAIKIWGNCVNWARFFGKKIFLYANSIGPFSGKEAENLAKKYLSKIEKITVRDKISLKTLNQLGLKGEVFTDPVFDFKISKEQIVNCSKPKKILALSLRETKQSFNKKKLNNFLESKEKEGFQILFISMEEKDSLVFNKFYSKYGRLSVTPKNFTELLDILSSVEICIGMRLHFLIASTILGKSTLAISYSSKVKGLMNQVGIKSLSLNLDGDFNLKFPINLKEQKDLVKKLNNCFRNFFT